MEVYTYPSPQCFATISAVFYILLATSGPPGTLRCCGAPVENHWCQLTDSRRTESRNRRIDPWFDHGISAFPAGALGMRGGASPEAGRAVSWPWRNGIRRWSQQSCANPKNIRFDPDLFDDLSLNRLLALKATESAEFRYAPLGTVSYEFLWKRVGCVGHDIFSRMLITACCLVEGLS